MVEVYDDHGDVEPSTLLDWWQDQGDVMTWANSGPTFYHYTNFWDEMGDKMYRPDNRIWVDAEDLVPETEAGRRNANYSRCEGNTRQAKDPLHLLLPRPERPWGPPYADSR